MNRIQKHLHGARPEWPRPVVPHALHRPHSQKSLAKDSGEYCANHGNHVLPVAIQDPVGREDHQARVLFAHVVSECHKTTHVHIRVHARAKVCGGQWVLRHVADLWHRLLHTFCQVPGAVPRLVNIIRTPVERAASVVALVRYGPFCSSCAPYDTSCAIHLLVAVPATCCGAQHGGVDSILSIDPGHACPGHQQMSDFRIPSALGFTPLSMCEAGFPCEPVNALRVHPTRQVSHTCTLEPAENLPSRTATTEVNYTLLQYSGGQAPCDIVVPLEHRPLLQSTGGVL
mmetsp:Transcript_72446/g.172681  ORF Transcript_72446/g.172681 Transcript_72446/m.172681 type:complete len:286 (-) Transcript_72446:1113-1970(-)